MKFVASHLVARRHRHSTVSTCGLGFAVLLAGAVAGSPSAARDRPGAPINMSTYECWGDRGGVIPNDRLKGPPAICTLAMNTAQENVRFNIRVIANGLEQNEAWLRAHVVGWYSETNGPIRHEADLTYSQGRPLFSRSYHERQSFAIYKLDFDTTYCVSLRTQYEDGVVSAGWTSAPCVRTRKVP